MHWRAIRVTGVVKVFATITLVGVASDSSAETYGEFADRSLKLYAQRISEDCKPFKGGSDERRRCMYVVSVDFLRQHGATCALIPDTLISGCTIAELTISKTPEKLRSK